MTLGNTTEEMVLIALGVAFTAFYVLQLRAQVASLTKKVDYLTQALSATAGALERCQQGRTVVEE